MFRIANLCIIERAVYSSRHLSKQALQAKHTLTMQTVVEMHEFIRCAKKLGRSDDERESIIDMIASNPDAGEEIVGTGGMRKLRVAPRGKGKSGGSRLITFFSGVDIHL